MSSKEELFNAFKELAKTLQDSHGYTHAQLLDALNDEPSVPASIFSTPLSPLQALTTHLHDHRHEDFKTIATQTKRSYRAVWGSYCKEGITSAESPYRIPLTCFDDHHSILESVVAHLKEHYSLRFSDIARLLKKDQRTIWTTWNRAKKKDARTH